MYHRLELGIGGMDRALDIRMEVRTPCIRVSKCNWKQKLVEYWKEGCKHYIRSPYRSSKPVKASDIRGTRNIV